MRILHVITRLILGGAQQNTVMSCAAQVEAGHDVHLAYGPIHGPEGSLLDEAKATGATLHEVPTLVRELAPLSDWQCYRGLRRLIQEIRPDVVHSHSSKAGVIVRAAAWRAKSPLQGGLMIGETGRPVGPLLGDKRRGLPLVLHTVHGLPFHACQHPLIHRLYVALERYAAKRCDHLVAIAPEMVDAFIEKQIAPRENFTVIPSGVDLDRFAIDLPRERAKQKLSLNPDAPVIGLVARLDPLKGHRDLLDALPQIVGRAPEAQVIFVGDGFDRATVEHAVAKSPHRDRVTMLNLVPFDEMPAVYRAIDVCVLPSYQEGQSRVLVEALAAGCGVVGYDVGGIPSVCVHDETGLLVPLGDTAELADAIATLLTDAVLRERLVEQGRRHVRDRFSAERMNRDLLGLYDRLVHRPDDA